MIKLVIFFLTLLSANLSVGAEMKSWITNSSPNIPLSIENSETPIEGNRVAAIRAPMNSFNESTLPKDIDDYQFGWFDYYYLTQTINCKKYRNKHLHLSSYLRLDKEAVMIKVNRFNKNLSERINDFSGTRKMLKPYMKLLLRFQERTQVHLSVFITKENGISVQNSTDNFDTENTQWQRLNVEAGVPKNCKSISIVVLMKGFGDLYVDDFVVSEQGSKNISKNRQRNLVRNYGNFRKKIMILENDYRNTFSFNNLGFERPN